MFSARLLSHSGLLFAMALGTVIICLTSCSHPQPKPAHNWNPKAAADYLDARADWWITWSGATRDRGTFCISCHTALPYVLARPVLREVLDEHSETIYETRFIDNVEQRVRLWDVVRPYYSEKGYDQKTPESRGTESVLNALILASRDAREGHLSGLTRIAFDNMWTLQLTNGDQRGTWNWLQFDQEPWEANDSAYYGAALAAIAVGIAPDNYALCPEIGAHVNQLREYLLRQSAAQSTINRVFLLWASTRFSGLLTPSQQKAIIEEALDRQQSDGGWRLASIAWRWNGWSFKTLLKMWLREDGTPLEGKSDGLATGLVTYVLEQAGVPRTNLQLNRGVAWLVTNQNNSEGFWPASSVNRRKSMTSDTGRFMSDAATAYAALALTSSDGTNTTLSSTFKH